MSVCERRLLKLNLWVNHRVPCQSSQGRSHKRCDNCHTPRLAFHMPISHASNAPLAAEARERINIINQPLGEFANRKQLPKEPKNLTQTLWVWDVAYARDSAEPHGWHGSSNCGWLQRHWTNIKGRTKVILHAQKRIESSNDLFGAHSQLDLPGDHSRKHGHRFRCLVREIEVVPPKHAP